MPATEKGIYHNLRESVYVASNGEVTLHFSSKLYLKKFIERCKHNRERFKKRVERKDEEIPLNFDVLADILLYEDIEKRGFLVRINKLAVPFNDAYKYAVKKMNDENTPKWKEVHNYGE